MAYPTPLISWGTAAPTDTTQYHEVGEIVMDPTPVVGTTIGWVCVTAGWPGTWRGIDTLQGNVVNTYTAAGTVATGTKLAKMTAGDNLTLSAANSVSAGFELIVQNTGSGGTVTCVAPSGSTIVGTATCANNLSARFFADGTGNWLRAN